MRSQLYYLILMIITLFSIDVIAQERSIEKGDKAYDDLNYISAIDIYTRVVNNGSEDPKLILRLANSYYFNGNFNAAAKWYKHYYGIKGVKPTRLDNYRYGQVLKTQKKYKESDSLIITYYDYKGLRYESFLKAADSLGIHNDDIYRIEDYRWNTDLSEYPAFINGNELYVVGYNLATKTKKRTKRTKTSNKSNIYKVDLRKGEYAALSEQINSPLHEGSAVISNDGKTMFFSRNHYYKNRAKKNKDKVVTISLYSAEFKNGEWKNIRELPFNSEEYSVGHPALSKDNKTLYYISDKPGGKGGTDLYKVRLFDDGTFGIPKNMVALNTPSNEMFPFVDKKDESLYFSSNGPSSTGGLDVFISKLNPYKVYDTYYNLGDEINSTYDDFAFVIGDNRVGYFASNRINDVGMDDIYTFKALRDFEVPHFFNLKGEITDFKTTPLDSVKLSLFDKDDNLLGSSVTDKDGTFEFSENDATKMKYIRAEKKLYQTAEKNIPSAIKDNEKPLAINMLSLGSELPEYIDILGKITNRKTGKPIFYTHVILLDINLNPIGKTTSNTVGDYSFAKVPTKELAFIRVEKEGYQTEEYQLDLETIESRQLFKDMDMIKSNVPLALGKDLGSILNPIYFDYAKSDITPDAKVELEKIVQILKKYKGMSIQIRSHADSRGRTITNLRLSRRRSLATYNYLISRGIASSRLYYRSFGESKLLNKCRDGVKCSRKEHEINRRSNFKILKY